MSRPRGETTRTSRPRSAVLVPLTTLVFPITAFGVFATGTADGDGRRVQPRMGDVRVGEGPRSPWWSEVRGTRTQDTKKQHINRVVSVFAIESGVPGVLVEDGEVV